MAWRISAETGRHYIFGDCIYLSATDWHKTTLRPNQNNIVNTYTKRKKRLNGHELDQHTIVVDLRWVSLVWFSVSWLSWAETDYALRDKVCTRWRRNDVPLPLPCFRTIVYPFRPLPVAIATPTSGFDFQRGVSLLVFYSAHSPKCTVLSHEHGTDGQIDSQPDGTQHCFA